MGELVAENKAEAEQDKPATEIVADPKSRASKAQEPTSRRRRATKPADTHVANALKTAYRETVQEDVPAEFLDLLGKLA